MQRRPPTLRRYECRASALIHASEELRQYLKCGVLAHGLSRLRCAECGADRLFAFSCKGRGLCPSCGGKRMTELAVHLVDRVIDAFE